MAIYPQLGTMLRGGLVHGLPMWTQPGGPGTAVYPQQQVGERSALFVMPFCGHWTNHIEVDIFQSAPAVRSALLLCPLCGCVVRVITPSDLYQDPDVNFILLP